jgi:Flp pilus assembly protein TadD
LVFNLSFYVGCFDAAESFTLLCCGVSFSIMVRFDASAGARCPQSFEILLSEGVARYQAGDHAVAAALFASAAANNPESADASRLHGLALVRAGRPQAALAPLARAVALAPRAALPHLHHGIGLLAAGCPARAAARCRRATMLEPAMPAAWINFSAALLALDQPKAARAAARRALALAPDNADARHALARGHAALGDLVAARDGFSAVLRQHPTRAEAWVDLGQVYARLGQMSAAHQAMEQALRYVPNHAAAAANLAGFSVLTGDSVESIAKLRAILTRDPGCVAARLNLANALLLDREVAEALTLLSGPPPRGREGAFWRAHRALALMFAGHRAEAARTLDAIPYPYDDAEILIVSRRMQLASLAGDEAAREASAERLAVLIGTEGASLLEHRVIAAFDLARLREGVGDHAAAFAHWRAGHRLMTRVQPFNRDAFRRFVDASIDWFSAHSIAGDEPRDADVSPVFVLGLPRSGTTLTEQILSSHAQVYGAGERRAVHDLVTGLGGAALHPDNPRHLAGLEPEQRRAAREAFLAALRAEAPDARTIIDKMPANALHLGFIATLLPGARFILCRRDVRDTGLSIFQRRFFGYHPYAHDLSDLGFYMAEHERLMAHWVSAIPGRIIEVALTDWVGDFPGTLARLEAFLDLPHDPACERFHESRRRVRTASAAQVRQPINARGLGRWRIFAAELAPMIASLEAAGVIMG